jgi:hypothetical protein
VLSAYAFHMKLYDLAMAEERDGSTMMHAANCPHVRKLADDGYPVMTMFGCQGLPDMLPRHSCLTSPENAEAARSAAG